MAKVAVREGETFTGLKNVRLTAWWLGLAGKPTPDFSMYCLHNSHLYHSPSP